MFKKARGNRAHVKVYIREAFSLSTRAQSFMHRWRRDVFLNFFAITRHLLVTTLPTLQSHSHSLTLIYTVICWFMYANVSHAPRVCSSSIHCPAYRASVIAAAAVCHLSIPRCNTDSSILIHARVREVPL